MKVNEFVEMYKENPETAIEALEIKSYIGIGKKYLIAKSIVNATVSYDENRVVKVDSFNLKMVAFYQLTTTYTNLEIDKDEIIQVYDALAICGALIEIENKIYSEKKTIEELTYRYLNDKLNYENATAKILSECIDVVLSSLNTTTSSFIDTVTGAISNIDVNKIEDLLKRNK